MQSQRHVSTDATYCMHLSTWSIWFVSSLLHVTFPAQSFQHSCSWFVPLPLKMPDLLRLLQRFAFRPKVHRTGQQKLTCWPVANLESWDLQCYWSFCKKGSLPLIPPLHTQRSPTKLQNHFIFAFAPRWVLLFCSMVASWPTLDLVGYLVIRMSGKHLFFLGTVALWLDLIALLSLNLGWTCSVLGTARQRRSDLCAKCNLSYSLVRGTKGQSPYQSDPHRSRLLKAGWHGCHLAVHYFSLHVYVGLTPRWAVNFDGSESCVLDRRLS